MEHVINGEKDQVLQLVLQPSEYIYADCHCVCWLSDNLNIRRIDNMFSMVTGTRSDGINIINKSNTPAMVALSQQQGGPILELKFTHSVTKGIYCFRESFICTNPVTNVVMKKLPFKSE